jgi:hypothetical protein
MMRLNVNNPKDNRGFYDALTQAKLYVSVPNSMLEPDGGYFYRADTREPEVIFREGFTPREKLDTNRFIYRLAEQDIELDSAISITHRFEAACIFPQLLDKTKLPIDEASKYKPPPYEIWVYFVYAERWFDTQDIQARFAKHTVSGMKAEWAEKARNNLFADEAATTQILPNNVVSANRVRRRWFGKDYTSGGQAEVLDGRMNDEAMTTKRHHKWHNSKSRKHHFGQIFDLPKPTDSPTPRGSVLLQRHTIIKDEADDSYLGSLFGNKS